MHTTCYDQNCMCWVRANAAPEEGPAKCTKKEWNKKSNQNMEWIDIMFDPLGTWSEVKSRQNISLLSEEKRIEHEHSGKITPIIKLEKEIVEWTSDKFKDKHPSSFSFGLKTYITSIMFAGPKVQLVADQLLSRHFAQKKPHSESDQGNYGQDSCK